MTIGTELPVDVVPAAHRLRGEAFEHRPETQNVRDCVSSLMELAVRGLAEMYQSEGQYFPQTMRGVRSADGPQLRPEGNSLRYGAIVALGLARLPRPSQKHVLAGDEVSQLARTVAAPGDRKPRSGSHCSCGLGSGRSGW